MSDNMFSSKPGLSLRSGGKPIHLCGPDCGHAPSGGFRAEAVATPSPLPATNTHTVLEPERAAVVSDYTMPSRKENLAHHSHGKPCLHDHAHDATGNCIADSKPKPPEKTGRNHLLMIAGAVALGAWWWINRDIGSTRNTTARDDHSAMR